MEKSARQVRGTLSAGEGGLDRSPKSIQRALSVWLVCTALSIGAAQAPTQAYAESQSATRCTKALNWDPAKHGYGNLVPGNDSSKPNCILQKSSTKYNGVVALQKALLKCERFDIGSSAADGVFGAKTEAALKKAQARYKISQDGIYGNNTRNKIRFYWSGKLDECGYFSMTGI